MKKIPTRHESGNRLGTALPCVTTAAGVSDATEAADEQQRRNEIMSDPQEAATPSDPHSAEAEAEYPYNSLYPDAITNAMRHSFDAGRVSRDAEVAELKAKIAAAVARLNAASIPPMMTEAQFNATTITDARRILLGSASSPVEGGN